MAVSLNTSREQAIACRGITKSYYVGTQQVPALRGIDLEVGRGEIFMLVGPSGCGKTTLISIIAGILRPDQGNCRVFGKEFAQGPSDELIEFRAKNIGFIFQSYHLLPALTVAENVAIPLIINGTAEPIAIKRAKAVLDELELGDRAESKPPELSGGQQQRVAIARALVHEPGLLVCDEPTSALDHSAGAHIMELMRRSVHQRHATLVIVTHDNRIFNYADRIAHMDDGRIVHIGDESLPPSPSFSTHQQSGVP